MTQSGQEPPDHGRRTADVSGDSRTRSGVKGSNRWRRNRRAGKGSKGRVAGPEASSVAGDLTESGKPLFQADTGPVDNKPVVQANGEFAGKQLAFNGKRRRRRRKGYAKSGVTQAAGAKPVTGHGEGQDADQQALASLERPTSPKGKKAARRRGRKRWQAGKDTGDKEPKNNTLVSAEVRVAPASGRSNINNSPTDGLETPVPGSGGERREVRRTGNQKSQPGNNLKTASLYAALDLGTNNCRLLIARPEQRGFRVVDAYSRIVRLGEGVGSNGMLSNAAMDRAIEALVNCHRKLADRGVGRSRLIATEACRAAGNGMEFIDRVRAETGLALEVVNRETEARLAVAGCASLVDHDADGVILFDIGGGSSEIVWLDLRNRCGARGYALTRFIRSWISLPVGVVNLAERHGGVHVTPDIFEAMVEDAAGHLAEFSLSDTLSSAIGSGRVHMLGTSGTVTTLAGVHLGLNRYDRRRVDGTWLDDHDVSNMIDQLRDMPYEARVENPCIGADRADLVLAGCAILEAIRRRWTCPRLRVADRGLREGILTELMAADGVWSNKRFGHRYERRRQRKKA